MNLPGKEICLFGIRSLLSSLFPVQLWGSALNASVCVQRTGRSAPNIYRDLSPPWRDQKCSLTISVLPCGSLRIYFGTLIPAQSKQSAWLPKTIH